MGKLVYFFSHLSCIDLYNVTNFQINNSVICLLQLFTAKHNNEPKHWPCYHLPE